MARIPVAQDIPQASLGALRAPAIQVAAPAQNHFEGLSEAAEELRVFAEVRLDEAETDEAKELDIKLSDELRTRMNGDGSEENPGYYSLRGKDAIDSHDIVSTANDDAIAILAESASSDRVRRKFETAATARREAELDRMSGHVSTARVDRDNTTSAARQDQALQDAATYWNDNKPGGMVEQSIGIIRQEAAGDAKRNGLDAESTKVYVAQAESKIHVAVIGQMMADGKDAMAEDYLTENGSKITDINTRIRLSAQVLETSKVADAQGIADQALKDAGGDFKLAFKLAKQRASGDELTRTRSELDRLKAEAKDDDLEVSQKWMKKNFTGDETDDLAKARNSNMSANEIQLVVADIKARGTEGDEAEDKEARKIVDQMALDTDADFQGIRDDLRASMDDETLLEKTLRNLTEREKEQTAVDKNNRTDAYDRAKEIVDAGGTWDDVTAADKSLLTSRQRKGLQAGDIEANIELNGKFNTMVSDFYQGTSDKIVNDPDTGNPYDFNQHIGEMPATTLQSWQAVQTKMLSDDPRERFKQSQIGTSTVAANKTIKSILSPQLRSTNKATKKKAIERESALQDHMRNFVQDWHEDNAGRMPAKVRDAEVYDMLITGTVAEDEFAFGFADDRSDVLVRGQAVGDITFVPDFEDEDNFERIKTAVGVADDQELVNIINRLIAKRTIPTLVNIREELAGK